MAPAWVNEITWETPASGQVAVKWATRPLVAWLAEKEIRTVALPSPEAGLTVNAALSLVTVQAAFARIENVAEVVAAVTLICRGVTSKIMAAGSKREVDIMPTREPDSVRPVKKPVAMMVLLSSAAIPSESIGYWMLPFRVELSIST